MDEIDFISSERLQTFSKHAARPKNAIALHNHTLQLGSSLMSLIAMLELSLRNSTNRRLVEDFGDNDWLMPNHRTIKLRQAQLSAIQTAIKHAQKAAYSKLKGVEKRALDALAYPNGIPLSEDHVKVVRKRQMLLPITHGQIISQTTFSFWKSLYSSEYELDLWKTSLKKVFPNKDLRRGEISTNLEVVYATRNRVAHHEPVYGDRLRDAMKSLDFLRRTLGAKKNETETAFMRFSQVQTLRLQMDYEAFLRAWDTLSD